jgi:hypothetical protein
MPLRMDGDIINIVKVSISFRMMNQNKSGMYSCSSGSFGRDTFSMCTMDILTLKQRRHEALNGAKFMWRTSSICTT